MIIIKNSEYPYHLLRGIILSTQFIGKLLGSMFSNMHCP